ncbi:MAG: NUDIX domain-containing protein [Bacteriovoracaceae bacterium]
MSQKTRKAQVVVAAFDAQSQSFSYLLLQTNQRRGEFWQNVTGKVEEGESYEEGGLREVIEETSLKPEWVLNFIDLNLSHDFMDQWNRNVHEKCFLCLVDHPFAVKIDPGEHESHRWEKNISRKSVKHEGNFEALQKAIKILEKEYT